MYTFNTITTVTVTNDAKVIKVKVLGKVSEELQLDEKTVCRHVFKRVYREYHRLQHSIIARNTIENFEGANSIQN